MSNNLRKEINGITIDEFSEEYEICRSATIKKPCNDFSNYRDIKEFYIKTGLSRNKTTEFLLSKIKKVLGENSIK